MKGRLAVRRKARKLAFLAAYLRGRGEDPEMLEPLLIECELASICFRGMARQLPPALGGGAHGSTRVPW